ncbi:MAG: hypothetical protein AB7H93_11335 [Vicinamibacterales bacterium]
MRRAALALALCCTALPPAAAQTAADVRAEREGFLSTAKVVATREVTTGITGTLRVTLDDGTRRHDASVQRIDQTKTSFRAAGGKREFGFRDTWKFNLAAYQVALLLGLETVPATVERAHDGIPASYTWWVDDVIMDEGARQEKKAEASDLRRWEHQMATMRVFDALIANTDRNKGNLLIDKDWTTWLIDHTRAFRRSRQILDPTPLVRCDRALLAALKALDEKTVKARTERWLTGDEIRAMMSRRDEIVARLEASPTALYTYAP